MSESELETPQEELPQVETRLDDRRSQSGAPAAGRSGMYKTKTMSWNGSAGSTV